MKRALFTAAMILAGAGASAATEPREPPVAAAAPLGTEEAKSEDAPVPCPPPSEACAEGEEGCPDEGDEVPCVPEPKEPAPDPFAPRRVIPGECTHGLDLQPDGPFAVMVFCDDGMGTTIGVVLHAPGAGGGLAWRLENRFWQQREWARDVTSFAWLPDRRVLYVATSAVYGTGGLYRLDLSRRLVRRLVPSGSAVEDWSRHTVKIEEVRLEDRALKLTLTDELGDRVRERVVALPE